MFWGLIMEAGKRYTQKVEKSFHISKACLDPVASGNEPVSVYVETDNKKFLICVLQKAVTLQSTLDLNFMLGDKIAFFIVGKGTVHVTGYLHDTEEDLDDAVLSEEESEEEEIIEEAKKEKSKKRKDQPQPTKQNAKKLKIEEEDSDDDDDSDVDLSDLEGVEEEEDDEDEEMDEDEGEEDEDDDNEDGSDEVPQPVESPPQKKSRKQKKKEKEQQKLAQAQSPAQDGKDKKAAGGVTPKPQTPQVNGTPNAQQSGKKDKKKKGGETPAGAVGTPKNQQQSPQAGDKQQTPQKRTVEGGVAVEDLKVGNGAPAKPGKLVTVYYTGRLKQNNKQFDATNQGPGFKFRLGKGEVIKGWDIGLSGMKVGGKRRIVIPPHMAYGAKGSPPVIPPNSALVFEVELRNVN